MKFAIHFLGVLTAVAVFADTPFTMPENPFRMSRISDRILVVDVAKVERGKPVRKGGMVIGEFVVKGDVVETLRGKTSPKEFSHTGNTYKIIDENAVLETFKDNASEAGIAVGGQFDEDGRHCRANRRYVVMLYHKIAVFVEVGRKDQTWRDRIEAEGGADQAATALDEEGKDKKHKPEAKPRSQ